MISQGVPAGWALDSLADNVVGTGGTLTVSLCDAATNYDTQISVFTGTCFQPSCLGGNDDGPEECGRTSEFTWLSDLFENYFVAIHVSFIAVSS